MCGFFKLLFFFYESFVNKGPLRFSHMRCIFAGVKAKFGVGGNETVSKQRTADSAAVEPIIFLQRIK